ncbi:MAG: hypothetical protein RLY86_3783 [Pseudomonadota bacterium]
MTAIIREHLEAVSSNGAALISDDPLLAYSQRRLSRHDAVQRLGLRDYADLLVRLGDSDFPLPLPPPHEVENQAAIFAKILRQS